MPVVQQEEQIMRPPDQRSRAGNADMRHFYV